MARLREAMASGSYLVISHADVSRQHVAGDTVSTTTDFMRILGAAARKG